MTQKELGLGAPGAQERLMSAVANETAEAVSALAMDGADPLKKDAHGRTALAEATMRFFQRPQASAENLAMMRLILSYKPNPNEGWGPNQETPLHLAMAAGSVEAARELVAAGADINAVNAEGDSALHIAARRKEARPQEAAYLLSLGIDPKIKNHKGRSALQEAIGRSAEVAGVIKAFTEANASMRAAREKKSAAKKSIQGQRELFESKGAAEPEPELARGARPSLKKFS